MPDGHSPACAAAVHTTPAQCRCACGGAFHGGPHSDRARALLRRNQGQAKQREYSGGQVSRAKTKARNAADTQYGQACTGFAVTFAIDRFVLDADSKEQGLVTDALDRVTTAFVEEIVGAALDDAESRNIKNAVEGLHILCALCATVLEAVEQVRELADLAADAVADQVITSLGESPLLTVAVKAALRLALRRSFGVLIDMAITPEQVKSIQFLGFISCPDVSEHPEVERYCVKPLAKDYLNDTVEAWVDDGFPRESRVLDGRSGRRRN